MTTAHTSKRTCCNVVDEDHIYLRDTVMWMCMIVQVCLLPRRQEVCCVLDEFSSKVGLD